MSLRADPIVLGLLGISLGADACVDGSHWRASAGAFHVAVPQALTPVVVQPSDGVRVLESALQLALLYDVDARTHAGFYVGPELYLYRLEYLVDGAGAAVSSEAYAHVTFGWTWFPFDNGVLFVQPWATLGVPVFHSGGAVVDGVEYRDRFVNWHATVAVGVRVF